MEKSQVKARAYLIVSTDGRTLGSRFEFPGLSRVPLGSTRSDALTLPAALLEQDDAGSGDGYFCDDDGKVRAVGVQTGVHCQHVGHRNFQKPKTEEIHDGRCDGVSSSVKRLQHDHSIGVTDVAVTDNSQTRGRERNHRGIVGEKANDGAGEDYENHADDAEKHHIVKPGSPHGGFRALRLPGAEILAYQGGRGVAQAPTGKDDKDYDANGDGVSGQRSGSENADDANQTDPAGVGNGELKDAGDGDSQQSGEYAQVDSQLFAEQPDALGAVQQPVELVEHPMLRPVKVASAAPVTPIRGKGPHPKIRQGSRTRLMMLETQRRRMAMAASPAPRKMALFRKSSRMAPLPPRAMRA
jgi:hypothetical protein